MPTQDPTHPEEASFTQLDDTDAEAKQLLSKSQTSIGTPAANGFSSAPTQETYANEGDNNETLQQNLADPLTKKSLSPQPQERQDRRENSSSEGDMRRSPVRWCMLLMACFFMVGNCFCYDNPGPLETQLQTQFHMDSTAFSLLYTVYSIPNMLLPIVGGIFLDRIGIRSGLLLFCVVLTFGQFVFMLGGYQGSYNLMLLGRIIFGMGGECMGVAQSSIISVWFKGKELSFALGLNLSMSRLGSVANANLLPSVYDSQGLGAALLVGFVICLFSLANAFGLVYLDKKAEQTNPNAEKAGVAEDEKFKLSDLYQFNASFWLLTVSCVLTYGTIYPFIQNASDMLQTKYHFDKITAGFLFGVPYLISAVTSPFLGLLIDKVGKRAFLLCLSSSVLILAFASSMMMPECNQCYNQVYPLVFTGLGYSVYAAAIWGSIPYVVAPSTVGTAFGITTAIQNIGLVFAPTLVGLIKDQTKHIDHGFFYVNVFFVLVNLFALLINMNLYYIDVYYNQGVLDRVAHDKQAPSKEEQASKGANSEETLSLLSDK
uniref:Lysosomal dipeptide transporter MFSD1 n=1 Tax=Strombidium rassoulzadegani TaxID=1082188 RepID=A0A7S3CJD5_9SPIT|mmetsp:Transcript_13123/g.22166  ORF Transcript_13123/g.22166 Transcript_13123/m.22166 type:complete len:544 (+) Transcript_13123:4-1635(+)